MEGITLEEKLVQEYNMPKLLARDLVAEYSESQILDNIKYFELAKKRGIVNEPIKYLYNAITKDYDRNF